MSEEEWQEEIVDNTTNMMYPLWKLLKELNENDIKSENK